MRLSRGLFWATPPTQQVLVLLCSRIRFPSLRCHGAASVWMSRFAARQASPSARRSSCDIDVWIAWRIATESWRGALLKAISTHVAGNGPDRIEPRVRKRLPRATSSSGNRAITTKSEWRNNVRNVQVPFGLVASGVMSKASIPVAGREPAVATITLMNRTSIPDRARTCNLRLRRPTLYPIGLRGQEISF